MNQEPNISLYGDGTGEEFPVLKAFQQYIDAEQAKARRRLLTVSIIFVVMLLAVVAIFSALVIKANNQTQALNDRLVEFAMKNPTRNYEEAKQAAIQELSVKTLNDTVARLQKQLDDQDRKASEAAAKAAREIAEAKAEAKKIAENKESSAAVKTDPVADKRAQEAELKLQKALAQLKAEKQKIADEKKKLREEELERYRREHYPEYYAKKEAANDKLKARRLTDKVSGILDDLAALDDDEDASNVDENDDEEFDLEDDEDDSYTIPVEVKGKSSSWRVPKN